MEIKIAKSELQRGLSLAARIAKRKENSTLPILQHLVLRVADKTRLALVATDLTVSVSADLPCEATGTGGIAVPASTLHDTIRDAPGDEVMLKATDGHWLEVKSGKAKWRIAGMTDRDFPKIASPAGVETTTTAATALRQMIDRTAYCVCEDKTRTHITGVFLVSTGTECTMASTDGHRLARATSKAAMPRTTGIIIPEAGAIEVAKLIGKAETCTVALKAPNLWVTSDGITVGVKLIDLVYPPIEQLLSIVGKGKVSVVSDRERLLAALQRIAPMTTETHGVRMEVNGVVTLSSEIERGSASDEIDADTTGKIAIGFCAKYVIDILTHIETDQVKLVFDGPLDPGVITPLDDNTYTCIAMPMRLQ
jgi:DNA polymerase III subunit beta